MIITKKEILDIIPHRDPFVMVGDLLEVSDQEMVTCFKVEKDNILCEEGELSFPGLIENIAQTCAVGLGYLDQQNGGQPKVGFIGAVSKLKTYFRPKIGETIKTKVQVAHKLYNVILIKGVSSLGEKILLECEMKIVVGE